MASVVLDASAVLALVRDEPGADQVASFIGAAAISAVNLQEVVKELLVGGLPPQVIRMILAELRLDVRVHDEPAAFASAGLIEHTRQHGRGLGDRTCMALGLALKLPVLTADREWDKLSVPGLDLRQIRS